MKSILAGICIVWVSAMGPPANAQENFSEHCLEFTGTSNQLCIKLMPDNQAEVRFKSLGDRHFEIAQGKLEFVTWSRADQHAPTETPPPGIRNLAPRGWGRETVWGKYAIRFALIGIENQVIWIRDNGLIAIFPVKPEAVKRIDYSSPNQQDLPPVGADSLREQLAANYYQTYTFISTDSDEYKEENFLVRYRDGNYLKFGPFPADIRTGRVPILKNYDPLKIQEPIGLALNARVGIIDVQYEIDLEHFWAMLTKGRESSLPPIVRSEKSPQIVSQEVLRMPPTTKQPLELKETLTLDELSCRQALIRNKKRRGPNSQ